MVGADSHRISRVPCYLGKRPGKPALFRLRDDRPLWSVVPDCSATNPVCHFPAGLNSNPAFPRNPEGTTRSGFNIPPVWALPFSLAATGGIALFSFPGGREMFHSPPFASRNLWIQLRDAPTLLAAGFPIRTSPGQRLFAAHRGLSQLIASFIDSWCQGIHRTPLVA